MIHRVSQWFPLSFPTYATGFSELYSDKKINEIQKEIPYRTKKLKINTIQRCYMGLVGGFCFRKIKKKKSFWHKKSENEHNSNPIDATWD